MVSDKKLHDNLSRIKAPSPIGKSIFVGLRLTDPIWQLAFLQRGWGSRIVSYLRGTPLPVLDAVSGRLDPYYQLLVVMVLGFFNTIINSTNILFAIWSSSSQAPGFDTWLGVLSSPAVAVGATAYAIGIVSELASELQRQKFKKDPANKGKPYGGGLFSLATNINYGAYTLWRGTFALTSGGWAWDLFTFSFFFYDFATRGVPVLNQYCTDRYGNSWTDIKSRVFYRLFPWVY
ncbi:uncharacterized protein N7511_011500 [Penicillium nucicola]|uniref:uncharacterized protein n=1 Tax=Penicillium nucicola TaxID=1850975 RepID=UPI002545BA37|nr:uncharacterized protein N7511_011500 [Penicillium nucicola]KAJ5742481.1 hypothetical protein N7511_011500 [Penicillium nucicola]